jgi:hypothetical protein
MALRFIDLKTIESQNTEPQAACDGLCRTEFRRGDSLVQRRRLRRVLLGLFLIDRIHYSMLDVQCSMFDVHQFLPQSDWPLFRPEAMLASFLFGLVSWWLNLTLC